MNRHQADDVAAAFEKRLEESLRNTDFHSVGAPKVVPPAVLRWLAQDQDRTELVTIIEHLVRSRKLAQDRRALAEGRRDWLEVVHSEGPWWMFVEGIERICNSVASAAREKRHEALDRRQREREQA